MIGRHRYLVCYDIRESKRLRLVHRAMVGWGESLQYSVFLCHLDKRELLGLRGEIGSLMDHSEDSVIIIHLGPVSGDRATIEVLGTPIATPPAGARII